MVALAILSLSVSAKASYQVNDLTVDEAVGMATVEIILTAPLAGDETVEWETLPGSAQSGLDFTASSGMETFLAGEVFKTVSIPIINDGDGECDEQFEVRLFNPTGTNVSGGNAEITISENDVVTLLFDPGTGALGSDAGAADADNDGAVDGGLFVYNHPNTNGGSYCFKITTIATSFDVWRTVLNVTGGEASMHLRQGVLPVGTNGQHILNTPGSEGLLLRDSQFAPGQNWYIRVDAQPGAQWSLFSGEPFVTDVGPLLLDTDGGYAPLNFSLPPEGTAFFRTEVPGSTAAWALWLNGDTRDIGVKKGDLPLPQFVNNYDRRQSGQMLLVPDYLGVSADTYFFAVSGLEGETLQLDSHSLAVQPLAYNATAPNVSEASSGAPYQIFSVDVPITSLAWDVAFQSITSGNPDVAIREGDAGSEFLNDAYSESPGAIQDSVTAVPPTLTDGTWYITVYSNGAFLCDLGNGDPEFNGAVQQIDFLDSQDVPVGPEPNPKPARSGWVYFVAQDIAQQNGLLGWELTLLNGIAGSEIAVRQNAVPGRMNYRNATSATGLELVRTSIGTFQRTHLDASSTLGFLQRPSQQADVWYVGVYLPDLALGPFDLQRTAIMPAATAVNGTSVAVVGHLPQTWKFYRFDILDGILGWEKELLNVSAGLPQIVTRRAQLPNVVGGDDRSSQTSWPNGVSVTHLDDWFTRPSTEDRRASLSAAGKPLELSMGSAVTYYVGIFNVSTTDSSDYTFRSRVIDDDNVPYVADQLVSPLSFTGAGSNVVVAGLAAEEVDWYRVPIPPNSRSWRIRVTPTVGDVRFVVRKDFVPEYDSRGLYDADQNGGVEMDRVGEELYQLLPKGNAEFLEECDYYIAVVAEQAGPANYEIDSQGEIPILGPIVPTPAGAVTAFNIPADEIELHRITVAAGTLSLEIRVDETSGDVDPVLRQDLLIGQPSHPTSSADGYWYGYDDGNNRDAFHDRIITVQNPPAGTYTLTLRANRLVATTPLSATGNLVVTARTSSAIAIEGGSAVVAAQGPLSWRYFEVTVPASGILGWDLRLNGLSGGDPRLVVCRDFAPPSSTATTSGFSPSAPSRNRSWPSGASWTQSNDWTNRGQTNNQPYTAKSFVSAFGAPLEAGTYVVGVYNAHIANATNYTLASRTIGEVGSGSSLELKDLVFNGGSDAVVALDPREGAFYRITIPPNQRSWKLEASPATAPEELCISVRHEFLPDLEGRRLINQTPFDLRGSTTGGGAQVQKNGSEFYYLFPEEGQAFLQAGDYFVVVASEGQNPLNTTGIGTGPVDGAITSHGEAPYSSLNLGTQPNPEVPLPLNPIAPENIALSLHAAEVKLFTFAVPAGASSLEVALTDEVGNDVYLALSAGSLLPEPHLSSSSYADQYGIDDGTRADNFLSTSLVTVAEPTAGQWTLALRCRGGNASLWVDPTTVNLRVQVIAPVPLAFCGGTYDFVDDQPPQSWRYYLVNVPALDPMGDPYLGWDIGVSSYTGGSPTVVVRRDELPQSTGNQINRSVPWPSGIRATGSSDWTGLSVDIGNISRSQDRDFYAGGRPLVAGTYFVGVFNSHTSQTMNYTIKSRCVGEPGSGADTEVQDLAFAGGNAVITNLDARQAEIFRVNVPVATESWRVRLTNTAAETAMAIRKGWVTGFLVSESSDADRNTSSQEGILMRRDGDEIYTLLPDNGQSTIDAGDYYIVVAGMGTGGTASQVGTGPASATLDSDGVLPVPHLGALAMSGSLNQPINLGPSEVQLYRFDVPAGIEVMEVRFENRTGDPRFGLRADSLIPTPWIFSSGDNYGLDSSGIALKRDDQIATLVNPAPGTYTISVRASKSGAQFLNATADLVIEDVGVRSLAFDAVVAGGGILATETESLIDGQERYYQVDVPSFLVVPGVGVVPVLGWKLTLTETAGNATMRVMNALGESGGFTETSTRAIVVPPFLQPGQTFYVEVSGTGLTDYTVTSEAITFDDQWTMPLGYNAEFGVSPEVDLAQDDWDFYSIDVPKGNGGILRTELVALNGNPNLYIREDGIPTTDHGTSGSSGSIIHRRLTGNDTEYANWVPLTRTERELRPGRWVLGVQASGSNSRYRLRASTGSVQDLTLGGGAVIDESVLSNDFKYYRVEIPEDAPVRWTLDFTEDFGDVTLHLRDTIPPGNGIQLPSSPTSSTDRVVDADDDNKNNWFYWTSSNSGFQNPGSYDLNVPPLRPGHTYFIGIRGRLDGTFDLSSSPSAELFTAASGSVPGETTYGAVTDIDFFAGTITFNLAAGEHRTFRVPVPGGATRWLHSTVRSSNIQQRLEQGTVPHFINAPHFTSNSANGGLNRVLSATGWPWLPGHNYYTTFINNGGVAESVTFTMAGLGALTGFEGWIASFGLTGPEADPNAVNNFDGVTNLIAYALGIHPINGVSPFAPIDPRPTLVFTDGPPTFPGLEFYVPTTAPADVCIVIEEDSLLAAPWNQLGIRAGQGGWTGTGFIVEEPASSGYRRVLVFSTNTMAALDRNFLRLGVFLIHP